MGRDFRDFGFGFVGVRDLGFRGFEVEGYSAAFWSGDLEGSSVSHPKLEVDVESVPFRFRRYRGPLHGHNPNP